MVPLFAQEAPPPLERATVLIADGEKTWPVAFHHMAVGFRLERAHHHVSIAARLGNGGGHAEVDAFLMREIGPEVKEGDEVARTAFELSYPFDDWVDIFNDLELEAGRYWLVLGKPKERNWSSINWFVTDLRAGMNTCNAHLAGSQSYTFDSDTADYLPASKFEQKYTPYAFQIEITELRAPGPDPCPQTLSAGTGSSR
jgi:hypothetical protein